MISLFGCGQKTANELLGEDFQKIIKIEKRGILKKSISNLIKSNSNEHFEITINDDLPITSKILNLIPNDAEKFLDNFVYASNCLGYKQLNSDVGLKLLLNNGSNKIIVNIPTPELIKNNIDKLQPKEFIDVFGIFKNIENIKENGIETKVPIIECIQICSSKNNDYACKRTMETINGALQMYSSDYYNSYGRQIRFTSAVLSKYSTILVDGKYLKYLPECINGGEYKVIGQGSNAYVECNVHGSTNNFKQMH